jgi:hypothetical protein
VSVAHGGLNYAPALRPLKLKMNYNSQKLRRAAVPKKIIAKKSMQCKESIGLVPG